MIHLFPESQRSQIAVRGLLHALSAGQPAYSYPLFTKQMTPLDTGIKNLRNPSNAGGFLDHSIDAAASMPPMYTYYLNGKSIYIPKIDNEIGVTLTRVVNAVNKSWVSRSKPGHTGTTQEKVGFSGQRSCTIALVLRTMKALELDVNSMPQRRPRLKSTLPARRCCRARRFHKTEVDRPKRFN
ncbi:predicted protein [Aspergillus nidulans FGSC A4]|uniref:Uncharacterized protein n=1 Tax=Emericella nidulans (strain FGSC A4 / ATCC 38163 / CBS 112.46 / NRRL 194 / M139) TaxID=227321 RepID=Q5AW78_EMENI|nr:hypothetical protein [Aspergillus nidulans FGSC A4]EAA62032.1 predicted protein [Aspergillus nidulans FGSC A4]CBF79410.1 TPA: hypothetical protein ANIA_07452 [Aspergillus nidulans FGSC A4]|eukprot:XP_680721.1 predicted protein [Aspergillus nidulans FGSC A4]